MGSENVTRILIVLISWAEFRAVSGVYDGYSLNDYSKR